MQMTEEQIERRCEMIMDHLDRMLLSGAMPQEEYDVAVRELDQWAKAKRT